ncbi:MAG: type 4a pilus biogenesis protein PilO [Patescibacteria group bacterium]
MKLFSRSMAIVACLILSAVLLVLMVKPAYQEWSAANQKIKTKEAELRSQQDYYDSLQKASKSLQENADSLAKIDASLPQKPDTPSLFEYFQKTASQNGLLLETISAPSISDTEKFNGKKIGFSLSLSGTYPSFKNLLSAFQKSARLIEIESIALRAPAKGDIFNFNISLETYSY